MSLNNSHIICLLVLVFSCFSQTALHAQTDPFVSKKCGFSIQFPGEPTEAPTPALSADEVKITMYSYEGLDKVAYLVSYTEYPPNYTLQNDPQLLLTNTKRSMIETLGIKKFDQDSAIDLDGYPGRQCKGTSGFYYVIYKVFIVDGTQYQVVVLNSGKYSDSKETEVFLESFKLLDDPSRNSAMKARDIDSILAEQGSLFTAPDSSFQINFPRPPLADTALVKADVGEVEMYSFKVDQGNQVLTVAFSDFPTALVELSDPKELLTGGKNTAMNSLELKLIDEEKETSIDGFPGIYFKGHSDKYYTIYKVYMVKNRLYQVAITKSGAYPNPTEVQAFSDSFTLLKR